MRSSKVVEQPGVPPDSVPTAPVERNGGGAPEEQPTAPAPTPDVSTLFTLLFRLLLHSTVQVLGDTIQQLL